MPILSVHASGDVAKQADVDVIIVPPICAEPDVVLHRVRSPQSYFQHRFLDKLQNARISIFDSPEDVDRDGSTSTIDRCARILLDEVVQHRKADRNCVPLHFVGHSTGGLVVKKALLLAEQFAAYSDISSSCRSVAFFGVPQKGSSVMSEAPFAQSVKRALGLKQEMSEALRAFLDPESAEIRILAADFVSLARKLRSIWTFVETEDSVLKILASRYDAGDSEMEVHLPIVDKRSALLEIGNETVIHLGTHHGELLSPGVFQSPSSMDMYLKELRAIVTGGLRKQDAVDADLKKLMGTELHLFYNGNKATERPSIKLWSVLTDLDNLLRIGPQQCFEARLFQPNIKRKDNHLIIPSESTKLDFSKRHPSAGRRSSIQAVLESPTDTDHNGRYSSNNIDEAPTITVTGPESPPTSPTLGSNNSQVVKNVNKDDSRGLLPVALPIPPTNIKHDSTDRKVQYAHYQEPSPSIRSRNPVTFQLPDPSQRLFRWAHVPCNNLGWIPEIMKSLTDEDHNVREYLPETLLHEKHLYAIQNVSRHGKPHSRYMRPCCRYFPESNGRDGGSHVRDLRHNQLSIFMPYLHWDSFKSIKRRNKLVEEVWLGSSDESKKERMRVDSSLERKLISRYLVDTANAPLHARRTLDQYGYPDLRSTQARDEDQVLYKMRSRKGQNMTQFAMLEEESKPRKEDQTAGNAENAFHSDLRDVDDGKVIMVDQLWCWVVDPYTVLTCFPPKEEEGERDRYSKPGDLRNAIYNDVNGDPRFATQCKDVFEFAAVVVEHATKSFIDGVEDEDLQVFRVFSEYISLLIEQHTTSFKSFRDRYRKKGAYGGLKPGALREEGALSKIQESDIRANEKDLTALLELRDIEDELNTIEKIFQDQAQVIDELIKYYTEWSTTNTERLAPLSSAASRIEGYKNQVLGMKKNCTSAQQAFMRLLDMKQKQANLAEAYAAREANTVASSQNRAVMVFTIFTIIFLPLSFFTSLFGMNTVDWTGNDGMPRLHLIFLITFPVSCFVIVTALLIAFNNFVREKVMMFFHLLRARLAQPRRHSNVDLEKLVGIMSEKDTGAAFRAINSAAVATAGYGQIPIELSEKMRKFD